MSDAPIPSPGDNRSNSDDDLCSELDINHWPTGSFTARAARCPIGTRPSNGHAHWAMSGHTTLGAHRVHLHSVSLYAQSQLQSGDCREGLLYKEEAKQAPRNQPKEPISRRESHHRVPWHRFRYSDLSVWSLHKRWLTRDFSGLFRSMSSSDKSAVLGVRSSSHPGS